MADGRAQAGGPSSPDRTVLNELERALKELEGVHIDALAYAHKLLDEADHADAIGTPGMKLASLAAAAAVGVVINYIAKRMLALRQERTDGQESSL